MELSLIEQGVGIVITAGTAIGGYFRWKTTRKKSTDMLLTGIEDLKQKLVTQITNDIERIGQIAEGKIEIAEKEREITALQKDLEEIKKRCPDCYAKVIKTEHG